MLCNIMYQILHHEKSKLMTNKVFLYFLSDHLRYFVKKIGSTQVLKSSTLFIVSIFRDIRGILIEYLCNLLVFFQNY